MTRYEIKWYVPQLADWILVGTHTNALSARDMEKHFRTKMSPNWAGDLKIVAIKIEEEEMCNH